MASAISIHSGDQQSGYPKKLADGTAPHASVHGDCHDSRARILYLDRDHFPAGERPAQLFT
jgi:hypothetical protein